MASALTISGKMMGKTQPIFANWELPLPEQAHSMTLRNLLTQIVLAEVTEFTARQSQRRLMQVLTPAQIRLGIEIGYALLTINNKQQQQQINLCT